GLAGSALLVLVGVRRERERVLEERPVDVGLVRLDVCDQLVEEIRVLGRLDGCHTHKCTSALERGILTARTVAEGKHGYRPNMTVLLARLAERRRRRQIRRVARLLLELDAAGIRPRRSLPTLRVSGR